MPDYVNPNSFVVHLAGPDGIIIKVKPHARVELSSYFERYVSRGFIKPAKNEDESQKANDKDLIKNQITAELRRTVKKKPTQQSTVQSKTKEEQTEHSHTRSIKRKIARAKKIANQNKKLILSRDLNKSKVVGKKLGLDPNELFEIDIKNKIIPISNNIGIGILSYQRLESLKRLVTSIKRYTDLRRTTVFISDDGSTNPDLLSYLESLAKSDEFVIIKNQTRLGVAGNSNRLIRCLSRFKYGILLNDDVEILSNKWEYFYIDAMKKTQMHHFIYRQPGVYGANKGTWVRVGDVLCNKVDDKPHGAVLAFTRDMLVKCGYFNEEYGYYGMEHVDWSTKAWEFDLQQRGFFDVDGSEQYFKLHKDISSTEDRDVHYKRAKQIFANRKERYRVGPSSLSSVAEITYVVPFRDFERSQSICTVINNIRAQRFPVVHIILVEQDVESKIKIADFEPLMYVSAIRRDKSLFNKSYAFNRGVQNAMSDKVILHDADMITFGDYASKIWNILEHAESCHIGGKVLYTDKKSCEMINKMGIVSNDVRCERVVGYFEGGSLACTKRAFWRCGGFNEDYWGYGCEDCDFYIRLLEYTNWHEDRCYNLIHLWHSRVGGWNDHHDVNKAIETNLKKLTVKQRVLKQLAQLKTNGYSSILEELNIQ